MRPSRSSTRLAVPAFPDFYVPRSANSSSFPESAGVHRRVKVGNLPFALLGRFVGPRATRVFSRSRSGSTPATEPATR